jgi:ribonucleotide monophosphatase NagD (HAD superfamily)
MPARPPLRALLIDLSGTLHVGDNPFPDTSHALARLRAAGIPLRFCSNASKESTAALHSRLERMGLSDIRKDELWTSVGAMRGVLASRGIKRYDYYEHA